MNNVVYRTNDVDYVGSSWRVYAFYLLLCALFFFRHPILMDPILMEELNQEEPMQEAEVE